MPAAAASPPQGLEEYSYARHYVDGETDWYELTTSSEGDEGKLIGLTEHESVVRNGIPHERVRWVRLSETLWGDLSELLEEVPVYELSLHPEGKLERLKPPRNSVLGIVTDLYIFYLAVSPLAGITQVKRAGDVHVRPELVVDAFADGARFRVGESRTQVRLKLLSITPGKVTYQTEFAPPPDPSLKMHREWMEPEACEDTPNNFQMVREEEGGFLVVWGCESSIVTTEIDPASGKILSGHMENDLVWRIKFCADEELTDCANRPDEFKRRLVDLRLRPPSIEKPTPDRLTVNPIDGLEYVWIRPGSFQMGCVPRDEDCYEEEKPRHRVTISQGFWMSRTEAPVSAYERFVEATGGSMPREPGSGHLPDYNPGWAKKDHPMVKVSWDDAQAFCEWAGGRLPTEAEWEYAARGGADGFKYPWGNDRSHDEANFWLTGGRDRWKHTAPAGSFPANGFGLYDMAGNVYEWVADWYDESYYQHSPAADPKGPAGGKLRVARGGAGFINPRVLRISARLRSRPDTRNINLGFRCARESLP